MPTDPTKSKITLPPLGSSLGSWYGALRGFNPLVGFKNFSRDFKTSAGIPTNAPLWTKWGGIQLGNMPTQLYDYAINPDAIGLDASKGFGGLGDVYNFGSDSPYSVLNGLNRNDVISNFGKGDLSMYSPEQLDAMVKVGDVSKTAGAVQPGEGVSLGSLANLFSGLYQGGKAVKGLYDNTQSEASLDSLKRDINSEIATNPMYDMYLDANDEKLIRQMRNGTLTNNWGTAMEGAVKGIPQAALSAVAGGLSGGIPGALIGGIGSLVNSGISGYGQGTEEASSNLQGLYDRLRQASQEYRTMKRPSNLRRAGLSTSYYNQLY